jgi:hypothetical protein
MASHGSNIGSVLKDIGKITFDTLEKFGIEYDEIIFGKPIAHVYIDDRSVNPYRHDMASMGLFNIECRDEIINQLPTNRYNTLSLENNIIVKSGPSLLLKGQAFFYDRYPRSIHFFPKHYLTSEVNGVIRIEMEYIRGITLFHLLKHKLLTTSHIDELFNMLDILHNTPTDITRPTPQQISDAYIDKFRQRLADKAVYPFEMGNLVENYTELLKEYTKTRLTCVSIIHGDFWMSNIILSFTGKILCFDMKGSVGDTLTLGGDPLYDYAKLYQSLLGYDCCLWGSEYDSSYRNTLLTHFRSKVGNKIEDIRLLSIVLMMGSLHAIETDSKRLQMWNWLLSISQQYHLSDPILH